MTNALRWTKSKPTDAGYYWRRTARTLEIVRVIRTQRGLAITAETGAREVSALRGQWAGPIPYPSE